MSAYLCVTLHMLVRQHVDMHRRATGGGAHVVCSCSRMCAGEYVRRESEAHTPLDGVCEKGKGKL